MVSKPDPIIHGPTLSIASSAYHLENFTYNSEYKPYDLFIKSRLIRCLLYFLRKSLMLIKLKSFKVK